MDTVAIAIEDFNIFLRDTLLEGAKLNRGTDALSMESYSTTSLTSISTEGLIDWVKDKLKKIGQKFVIVVNKVIARFSKNRAELEANIAKYKQNPKAEVKLAVSPKTLRNIGLTIAAIAAGIVAIFVCINRKGGKEQMAEVVNKVENKVKATEADIEKDKAKGGVTVSAGEAANATAASVAASKKTETVLKAAASKVAQGASGGDPASLKEKFTNTVAATKHSAMLAKHGYSLSRQELKTTGASGATSHILMNEKEGTKNLKNRALAEQDLNKIIGDRIRHISAPADVHWSHGEDKLPGVQEAVRKYKQMREAAVNKAVSRLKRAKAAIGRDSYESIRAELSSADHELQVETERSYNQTVAKAVSEAKSHAHSSAKSSTTPENILSQMDNFISDVSRAENNFSKSIEYIVSDASDVSNAKAVAGKYTRDFVKMVKTALLKLQALKNSVKPSMSEQELKGKYRDASTIVSRINQTSGSLIDSLSAELDRRSGRR